MLAPQWSRLFPSKLSNLGTKDQEGAGNQKTINCRRFYDNKCKNHSCTNFVSTLGVFTNIFTRLHSNDSLAQSWSKTSKTHCYCCPKKSCCFCIKDSIHWRPFIFMFFLIDFFFFYCNAVFYFYTRIMLTKSLFFQKK